MALTYHRKPTAVALTYQRKPTTLALTYQRKPTTHHKHISTVVIHRIVHVKEEEQLM